MVLTEVPIYGKLVQGTGCEPSKKNTQLKRIGSSELGKTQVSERKCQMYCETNFKTKKELREAVAAGKPVRVFEPGVSYGPIRDGEHSVEGPHSPKPHMWYARVTVVNGLVTKVK